MRRFVFVLVTFIGLVCVAVAVAGDPRLEKKRLNPADMKAARATVLQLRDLGAGWKREKLSDDDEPLTCPGYRPDFSRFVITGEAETEFTNADGWQIASAVEVYLSRAHAVGDFRVGAKPAVASCLRQMIEQVLKEDPDPEIRFRVLSSRMLASPGLGERSAAYGLVARVTGPGGSIPFYVDLLAFQKGRTIGVLVSMTGFKRLPERRALAAEMAGRAR